MAADWTDAGDWDSDTDAWSAFADAVTIGLAAMALAVAVEVWAAPQDVDDDWSQSGDWSSTEQWDQPGGTPLRVIPGVSATGGLDSVESISLGVVMQKAEVIETWATQPGDWNTADGDWETMAQRMVTPEVAHDNSISLGAIAGIASAPLVDADAAASLLAQPGVSVPVEAWAEPNDVDDSWNNLGDAWDSGTGNWNQVGGTPLRVIVNVSPLSGIDASEAIALAAIMQRSEAIETWATQPGDWNTGDGDWETRQATLASAEVTTSLTASIGAVGGITAAPIADVDTSLSLTSSLGLSPVAEAEVDMAISLLAEMELFATEGQTVVENLVFAVVMQKPVAPDDWSLSDGDWTVAGNWEPTEERMAIAEVDVGGLITLTAVAGVTPSPEALANVSATLLATPGMIAVSILEAVNAATLDMMPAVAASGGLDAIEDILFQLEMQILSSDEEPAKWFEEGAENGVWIEGPGRDGSWQPDGQQTADWQGDEQHSADWNQNPSSGKNWSKGGKKDSSWTPQDSSDKEWS